MKATGGLNGMGLPPDLGALGARSSLRSKSLQISARERYLLPDGE